MCPGHDAIYIADCSSAQKSLRNSTVAKRMGSGAGLSAFESRSNAMKAF